MTGCPGYSPEADEKGSEVSTQTATGADPRRPGGSAAALLAAGAAAGPLFIVVALAQVFAREGFDPARHPLSLLSLGDLGWVQICAFVVAGLAYVGAAVGMRRVMRQGPGGRWAPRLIGTFGVCLVAGGVLVADPAFGFPPGTPPGPPAELTWHGALHGIAPAAGFLALVLACLVMARWFAAGRARAWSAGSAVTGVAILPLSVWPNLTGDPEGRFLPLWVAMVLGFAWASLVAARLAVAARTTTVPVPAAPPVPDDVGTTDRGTIGGRS